MSKKANLRNQTYRPTLNKYSVKANITLQNIESKEKFAVIRL